MALVPSKFLLESLKGSIPDLEQQLATPPTLPAVQKCYHERDLHPLLVWFAHELQLRVQHCKTIYHEKSVKKGEKQNQWIHPDIVGFSLTTRGWTDAVVQP